MNRIFKNTVKVKKNKISKSICLLALTFMFGWSCTNNEDERIYQELMNKALAEKKAHPEINVFDGDVEPEMPDRKINDSTLYGVDANKNELRDDVEIWINRTFKDPNIRMAFKQKHKVFQRIMKAKVGMSEISNKLIQEESNMIGCAKSFFENYNEFTTYNDQLNKLGRNIHKRSLQYNNIVYHINVPIGGPVLEKDEAQAHYCTFLVLKKEKAVL